MPATPAIIRASAFEYRAVFQEPIVAQWRNSGPIVEAAFRAFKEWKISLEQVSETLFAPNFSQQGILFSVLARYNFRVAMSGVSLNITNPAWEEMGVVAKIIEAGTAAVRSATAMQYDRYETVLDIHVSPQGVSLSDLTQQFIPRALRESSGANLISSGFTYNTQDRRLLVDASAYFPDAFFLRLFRNFAAGTPFLEMGEILHRDEVELLTILGLAVEGVN